MLGGGVLAKMFFIAFLLVADKISIFHVTSIEFEADMIGMVCFRLIDLHILVLQVDQIRVVFAVLLYLRAHYLVFCFI